MSKYPYPEHAKQRPILPFSQKIGEFVEWLEQEKQIYFAQIHSHGPGCPGWDSDRNRYNPDRQNRCGFHDDELFLSHASITKLLAEFFEIDLKKLEIEKEAMLDAMREHHEAKDKAKSKSKTG
jgi:hypothetical protein